MNRNREAIEQLIVGIELLQIMLGDTRSSWRGSPVAETQYPMFQRLLEAVEVSAISLLSTGNSADLQSLVKATKNLLSHPSFSSVAVTSLQISAVDREKLPGYSTFVDLIKDIHTAISTPPE